MEKVILKSRDVTREERPTIRRAQAIAEGAHAEVRTIEDHGVVRAIEVTCTCGDRTTVELDIQESGTAAGKGGI